MKKIAKTGQKISSKNHPGFPSNIFRNFLAFVMLSFIILAFNACGRVELVAGTTPNDWAETANDYYLYGNYSYNRGKYDKAVKEYTISVIGYQKVRKRLLSPNSQWIYDEDNFNAITHNLCLSLYQRGLALKQQGNYFCAREDFHYITVLLEYGELKRKAQDKMLEVEDLIQRSGLKGRTDCPKRTID